MFQKLGDSQLFLGMTCTLKIPVDNFEQGFRDASHQSLFFVEVSVNRAWAHLYNWVDYKKRNGFLVW